MTYGTTMMRSCNKKTEIDPLNVHIQITVVIDPLAVLAQLANKVRGINVDKIR